MRVCCIEEKKTMKQIFPLNDPLQLMRDCCIEEKRALRKTFPLNEPTAADKGLLQ